MLRIVIIRCVWFSLLILAMRESRAASLDSVFREQVATGKGAEPRSEAPHVQATPTVSLESAMEALTAARVPCSPVRSMDEILAHPHMAEREAFTTIPHAGRGEVRVTSAPFHIDGAAVPARGAAPYLAGENTRAVLAETLGYPDDRIEALLRSGAVAVPAG